MFEKVHALNPSRFDYIFYYIIFEKVHALFSCLFGSSVQRVRLISARWCEFNTLKKSNLLQNPLDPSTHNQDVNDNATDKQECFINLKHQDIFCPLQMKFFTRI